MSARRIWRRRRTRAPLRRVLATRALATISRSIALGRSTQIRRLPNLGANGHRPLLGLMSADPVLPVLARVGQLVHRARSRQRRDGQPNARIFGVGGVTRGEPGGVLLLVSGGRFGVSNQINE